VNPVNTTRQLARRAVHKYPRLYYIGPAVLWAGAIFFASSESGDALPHIAIPNADKGAHLVIYLILGALVARAAGRGRPLGWRGALAAWLVAIGFGLTDEIHQLFVPGRSCDWRDWLTDCLGSAAGIWLWLRLLRWPRLPFR